MKKNKLFTVAVALLALQSCKVATTKSTNTSDDYRMVAPREKTLYVVGFQWGEPNTFNPLNAWPAWPIRPEFNLMYEQLTKYNSLTNKTEPLLARIDSTTNEFVSVILNREAKWSDGTPLTAADVKFSYELNLDHPEAPNSNIADLIDTVTVEKLENEEERITFHVKKDTPNPLRIVDLLSMVQILPRHVWEPLLKAALGEFHIIAMPVMDRKQVISGPYNILDYSSYQIVLKRRDDYWGNSALYGGKTAQPTYLVHYIFKNNKEEHRALQSGAIDLSANYIPSVGKEKKIKTWIDSSPYYRYGSIPMFIINTTKRPMDDKHFRRAMAFAIDYDAINKESFFGYSPKINSGLILPDSKYFSQNENEKYGATIFDPKRAKEELKLAGIKSHYKDTTISRGDTTYGDIQYNTTALGDTLSPLMITSPAGWSDFSAIVNAAVKSMRKCGIDVRENFVSAADYWPNMATGDFDLLLDTPSAKRTHSMPYSRFERILSSRKWKDIGAKMYKNSGRFNNPHSEEYIPAIDSLIKEIPTMSEEDKREAYTIMNRHFMEQQPTLPLLYRPEEFYHFNTKFWKNFPVQKDNGTLPPLAPVSGAARDMLWQITPAK